MHALFFATKRAFHATLRFTRRDVTALGLTAARFDLLAALKQRRRACMIQSALRRTLGVTRPTVSRMLRSLEELHFIRREPYPFDRRQRMVTITAIGRAVIRRAIRVFMRSGLIARSLARALVPERWRDEGEVLLAMHTYEAHLNLLRDAYGDTATLYYPWHPED